MKMAFSVLGSVLLLLFTFSAQSGQAIPISGTGTWGSFEGSISYTCHPATETAKLEVVLTNTSPAGKGGYLTGFAFNNPGDRISGVTFSDSVFELLGAPDFDESVHVAPSGHFDIGAALGNSWKGAGDPWQGIAVGQRRTFLFTLSGEDLCDLDVMDIVSELAEGGAPFLAIRFGGFEDGDGETVTAAVAAEPATAISPAATSFVPDHYGLMPNYPNPFNSSTAIGYQIPGAGHVTLTIYDVLGRTARRLVKAYKEAGGYTALWDGRDDEGHELKSGVYYCVLEAGDFSKTIKMVLMR